jgi:hypothetical protein
MSHTLRLPSTTLLQATLIKSILPINSENSLSNNSPNYVTNFNRAVTRDFVNNKLTACSEGIKVRRDYKGDTFSFQRMLEHYEEC